MIRCRTTPQTPQKNQWPLAVLCREAPGRYFPPQVSGRFSTDRGLRCVVGVEDLSSNLVWVLPWFSKPISLRVRTWCRYSLALKPICLEQTVRMTHEGFTSLASGARARRLSGLNHAIFLRGPELDSGVNDANFCTRCGPDGVFLWVKDLYVYPRHILAVG